MIYKMITAQISRVQEDFDRIAQEPVRIEYISSCLYAYGTELACLRLAYKFRKSGDGAKCAYSENLNTWCFRLEV